MDFQENEDFYQPNMNLINLDNKRKKEVKFYLEKIVSTNKINIILSLVLFLPLLLGLNSLAMFFIFGNFEFGFPGVFFLISTIGFFVISGILIISQIVFWIMLGVRISKARGMLYSIKPKDQEEAEQVSEIEKKLKIAYIFFILCFVPFLQVIALISWIVVVSKCNSLKKNIYLWD